MELEELRHIELEPHRERMLKCGNPPFVVREDLHG